MAEGASSDEGLDLLPIFAILLDELFEEVGLSGGPPSLPAAFARALCSGLCAHFVY